LDEERGTKSNCRESSGEGVFDACTRTAEIFEKQKRNIVFDVILWVKY